MINEIVQDATERMGKSVTSFESELSKIRTGRAHASLLDHIQVDYYGSVVPISQVANISVEDARTLSIMPWEADMVAVVEKAIMKSDLGLNPSTAGSNIRVPMPALTEERRKDLVKVVRHEAENGKVAIRNIRRDANTDFKELVKAKDISEDDDRRAQESIQKLTDKYVAEVDKVLTKKETELMEV
ncbi:Ribosome recycling factor [hydrothermal vent metagenome]|uniref:Ribosome recycling factor n=1 Tax=hydrothermal vent metagenome TaxID=652676 RepID=A0A3B0Y1B9_9ZZZZ